MPDVEIECQFCGGKFVYSTAEQQADERKGYPPPRACGPCLRQRRAAGAAKRAAKRPRWRRYNR
ncbi:MAG: hypothetical protein JXA57_05550 [Armatimonadetes bacterium]|nr:hypothetical protein [Armatimonadota bacterium]